MPIYIIETDDALGVDRHEVEFANLKDVRIHAVKLLAAMVSDEPELFWKAMNWRLAVKDQAGLTLFELHTSAVETPSISRI